MSRRSRGALSETEVRARIEALRAVDLFSAATDDDLRPLAKAARERQVGAGTEVVREGYLPTHVYVIRAGEFDVVSRGEREGEARVVNTLGPSDHFGEIGLIEGMPATATVRSKGKGRVLEIPGEAFLTFVDASASLTEVADRVSGWLAKTHPSYRPSVSAGAHALPPDLLAVLSSLDADSQQELRRALERLSTLSPEDRRTALHRLAP